MDKKNILTYKEFILFVINFTSESIRLCKDTEEEIKKIGHDPKPFYEELPYLQLFAVYSAIRKKFPVRFEKIIEDINEAVFGMIDESVQDLKVKLESKIKLNERMLEYMGVWNDALKRSKEINDNSQLNNPVFTAAKKASINAYGDKEGMDIRLIIFFSSAFTGPLYELNEYLEKCEVIK